MLDHTLNDRLFLSFSVALGFIVAGTGNALFGPRARWTRAAIAAVGLGVSVVSVLALIPDYAVIIASSGAGGLLLSLAARSGVTRRAAAGAWDKLCRPRLVWGLAALGGFALLGGEMLRFDLAERADLDEQESRFKTQTEVNPFVMLESRVGMTDRGNAIHLLTAGEAKSALELFEHEQSTLQSAQIQDYVIRRGPADDTSNCHGWVFAGGKFAILGHEVETILADNDYELVSEPYPGDLCVYRNGSNAVAHTALVRSVFDDGTILVEGKWGRYGVFLHPVERSVYGDNFGYYRTDRPIHILNSIP